MSDEQEKIQWHPAFCDAMELTLRADADVLTFEREFNLSSKPLQVDLLVIKKSDDRPLSDPIAAAFRRHNIIEYKSPGDSLTIDDFYKAMAYGCLYKVLTSKHVNEVRAEDITLTLVREELPKIMFQDLADEGTTACVVSPGIYELDGNLRFTTQVIVTSEITDDSHVWLRGLTREIDDSEAKRLVEGVSEFRDGTKERREADAILHVAARANEKTFERLQEEDKKMSDALDILFGDRVTEMDLKNIRNVMNSFNVSAELAMTALKIAPEKRERYARLIAEGKGVDSDSGE